MVHKVVIIDDNFIVVRSLCSTIDWKKCNCKVVGKAYNGPDGLSLVRKTNPDIVITDIMMSGFDGLELIQKLQNIKSSAKFIVITGYDDFTFAQTALRLNVRDIILKPIDNRELENALVKACRESTNFDFSNEEVKTEKTEIEQMVQRVKEGQPNYNPLVSKAIDFIDVHIFDGLTLRMICEYFKVSSSHFGKCFKKYTGVKFISYLTGCKMVRAKELLKDPKVKVYEVGQMLGYDDYAYFYQVFKKSFGFPPGDLKMKNKNL